MHFKNILFAACLGAALIGATGAVHAGTANAITGAGTGLGRPSDSDMVQAFGAPASAAARAGWDEGGAYAHGSAHATAGDGFVKAYGEGSAFGSDSDGAAGGRAQFFEDLTFSSAVHDGMPGQVTIAVLFNSDVEAFGESVAATNFSFRVHTSAIYFSQFLASGFPLMTSLVVLDAFGTRVLPYASVASMTFDLTWGDTLHLEMDLFAEGHTSYQLTFASGAQADASHSGYWGGIVSATAGGVAIDDFSVLSSTGLDYRNSFAVAAPVPEPESVALLAVGLLAVWVRARRAGRRERAA